MEKGAARSQLQKTRSLKQTNRRPATEQLEERVLFASITTLASFTNAGVFSPSGTVVTDSAGSIYGIANGVGSQSNTCGIYKLAKNASAPTLVASLPPDSGFAVSPVGLVIDSHDNIFGVTNIGGDATLDGTVFELAKGASSITTLASFDQTTNGHGPNGNIVIDAAGANIYGVCNAGGILGGGSVWKFSIADNVINQIAAFAPGSGLSSVPDANSIAIDAGGNLFGTTAGSPLGGVYGTVWEVPAQQVTIQTLATFTSTNGAVPNGSIVVDASGNIFGETHYGGANSPAGASPAGLGTVYEIAAGSGIITTLSSFAGTDGQYPIGGLIADSTGNLFGVASSGGTTSSQASSGAGTVFEVPSTTKTMTPLILFNGTNGGLPKGGLTLDSSGKLVGTGTIGGASSAGNIFQVDPSGGGGSAVGTFAATATVKGPASIIAGQKIAINIASKLTNTGGTTVSDSFSFAAYLSANGAVDNNSILLVSSTASHFSLKPKKFINAKATVRSTNVATPAGTYHYIIEYRNATGTAYDVQSNNIVTVAAPKLDIGGTFAKFVSTAKHGKTVTETLTISNAGANVIAAGTLSITVAYLQVSAGVPSVPTPVTIKKKISVRPGKTLRLPLTLKAPASTGNYTIFITLDATAIPGAADTNLANNTLTSPTSLIVS